jgi:membrane protein
VSNDEVNRGRGATRPFEFPLHGWKEILGRVLRQTKADHVSLVAAGVAFYAFLALFPALIAIVAIYGSFTDPADLQRHLDVLSTIVPQDVHDLLSEQLQVLTEGPDRVLGWSAVISILISLWSANKGTKALFEGLNIAYDEEDARGFLGKNALTLLFTFGIAAGFVVAAIAVIGFSALSDYLALPGYVTTIVAWTRWPLIAALLMVGLALLYKVAPARSSPRLRWVSVGAAAAICLWLVGSVGFSLYVERFGSYANTYGSLAAIAIFLLWLYLSAFVVLLGAEINSEMEHQTAEDTTVGPDRPMGFRGAYHADHVA